MGLIAQTQILPPCSIQLEASEANLKIKMLTNDVIRKSIYYTIEGTVYFHYFQRRVSFQLPGGTILSCDEMEKITEAEDEEVIKTTRSPFFTSLKRKV